MKKFYINKNLIFVALLVVIQLFREEISEKIFNLLIYDYTKYECNFDFLTCISKLFLIIPYLLNKKFLKKNLYKNILISNKLNNLKIVKKKNYYDNIYLLFQIFFFIFSCSFLNFFSMVIYQTSDYYYSPKKSKFNYDEYYSIILFILYQIISNTNFYNFHYVSISILLFVLIFKNIFNVYKYKEGFINNLKDNLTNIILRTLFSLYINLIKYLNVLYYLDMYLIFFISEGILFLIYFFIYQSFLNQNYFEHLDFSSSNLLYYFIFIVIFFLNDYIFVIVVFLFNPIYYGFAILIRISFNHFYELFIENNSHFYNISIIFISLFDIISVLIYSELIQLNCFNLSKNTMNNMMIRAENEIEIQDLSTLNSK